MKNKPAHINGGKLERDLLSKELRLKKMDYCARIYVSLSLMETNMYGFSTTSYEICLVNQW